MYKSSFVTNDEWDSVLKIGLYNTSYSSGLTQKTKGVKIGDTFEPSYPFDPQNNPTKPQVVIHTVNADAAYTTIRDHLEKNTPLPSDLVEGYLHAAAVHLEVHIQNDWVSYGIRICRGGNAATPQNLVEVVIKGGKVPALLAARKAVTPTQHLTLVASLMSVYRLAGIDKTHTGTYYANMEKRIQDILRSDPFDEDGQAVMLGYLVQHHSPWKDLPAFERMVAAYDTILEKSPAPWSLMRVTTVTSAYKGCNGLLSLNHLSKKLGLPLEEALGYVMNQDAVRDLLALLHPHQEVDITDSYFTHCRAFGFTPKSPYSAMAVPHIFNYIHLTGAYMGDARSLNAVAIPDAGINQIAGITGFLGEYFRGGAEVSFLVGKDAAAEEKRDILTGAKLTTQRSPARLAAIIRKVT